MRNYILIIACLFITPVIKAQFYVGLNAGYGMGVQGRTLADFYLVDVDYSTITTINNISGKQSSLGGGFTIGPMIGYTLNQFLGFELGMNYNRTNKIVAVQKNNLESVTNISLKGNLFSIKPSLLAFIFNGNPKVYSKLGLVYNRGNFKYDFISKSPSSSESISFLFKNGNALGITFALGTSLKVTEKWSLHSEVAYNAINYYPQSAEMTKNIVNGIDKLPTTKADERTIIYSKTGSTDGDYYGSVFGKGVLLRPQIPMNGLGINIGLIYTFKK